MSKWKVSKHDCAGTRASYSVKPCDPPCYYPWQVDGPDSELSDVFAAWAEAIEWAIHKVTEESAR